MKKLFNDEAVNTDINNYADECGMEVKHSGDVHKCVEIIEINLDTFSLPNHGTDIREDLNDERIETNKRNKLTQGIENNLILLLVLLIVCCTGFIFFSVMFFKQNEDAAKESTIPNIKGVENTRVPSSPSSAPVHTVSSSLPRTFLNQIGSDISGVTKYQFIGKSVSLSHDGSRLAIGGVDQVWLYYQPNDTEEWILSEDLSSKMPNGIGELIVTLSNDGQMLAVGGPMRDYYGVNNGEVRIFKMKSRLGHGNEEDWIQVGQELYGMSSYDFFGNSISFSDKGSKIAIGASGGNYVSLYEITDDDGVSSLSPMKSMIRAPFSSVKGFGHQISLSINGNILAVGSPWAGASQKGSVFLYDVSKVNDVFRNIVIAQLNGRHEYDWFGWSVSLSSNGTSLAVGAPNGSYVAIFRKYSNGNKDWELKGPLILGKNGVEDDYYGVSVGSAVSLSNDGNIVAVNNICSEMENSGKTQIFAFKDEAWVTTEDEIRKDLNNTQDGYFCTMSVSLSGNGERIALGTILGDHWNERQVQNTRGHVKVFHTQIIDRI